MTLQDISDPRKNEVEVEVEVDVDAVDDGPCPRVCLTSRHVDSTRFSTKFAKVVNSDLNRKSSISFSTSTRYLFQPGSMLLGPRTVIRRLPHPIVLHTATFAKSVARSPYASLLDTMDIAPGASTPSEAVVGEGNIQVKSHNQYHSPRILPDALDPSPLVQFQKWFGEAIHPTDTSIPKVTEPEAMAVSTATAQGIPSSRFVLLKEVDTTGFVFYTNYTSRKSQELLENPYASIAIYWREVSRQVRVVGKVEKVSRSENEEYFASRPRGSRIGAWASEQSKHVGEDELKERVELMEEKFADEVPCPEHWGGWRIVPL